MEISTKTDLSKQITFTFRIILYSNKNSTSILAMMISEDLEYSVGIPPQADLGSYYRQAKKFSDLRRE